MQSPSDVQKSQYPHDSGMGTLSPIMSSAPPVLFCIWAGGKMGCMPGGYPCQVLLSRLYRCSSHRVAVVHDVEPAPFRIGNEPFSLGIYRHLLSCLGVYPDDLCSAASASAHRSPPSGRPAPSPPCCVWSLLHIPSAFFICCGLELLRAGRTA